MVHPGSTERQLFSEILGRELRDSARLLRAFPPAQLDAELPDCPRSSREMAWGFVERVRRVGCAIHSLPAGPGGRPPASKHQILDAYDRACRQALAAVAALSFDQWNEAIRSPGGWERARRGELLWGALKELVHHRSHFALHLQTAQVEQASQHAEESATLAAAL